MFQRAPCGPQHPLRSAVVRGAQGIVGLLGITRGVVSELCAMCVL